MRIYWLGTTAIAFLIGTGAALAQSQPDLPQKRDESPRAQTPSPPSKGAERPAANEPQPADRLKEHAAQPKAKAGAQESQRGEAASVPERKEAQEPQPRDTKQPARQSQEQRDERAPARPTQQSQDEQRGREAKQPAEPKQRQGREEQPKEDNRAQDTKQQFEQKQRQGRDEQPKQDNRAQDAKQPADAKQQQGQRQQEGDRNDQAARPNGALQGGPADDTAQDRARGRDSGQAQDQSTRREGRSSAMVNDKQRTQIIERLRRERSASSENVNMQVNVGERLPQRVRPRPLPPDIVRIAPQYRDYEYTVIDNRVAIVDPRTREVVDILDEPGSVVETTSRSERDRVVIAPEQREILKQAARRMTTVGSSAPSGSGSDSSCLTLQPVPEDLVRTNPDLGSYRYLAIGNQVVLVDPRQQKIVDVIN
jgi:hypothetical protein